MSKSGSGSGTDEAKVKPLAAQEQKVASQAEIRPTTSVFADIDARMKAAKAQRDIPSVTASSSSAVAADKTPSWKATAPTVQQTGETKIGFRPVSSAEAQVASAVAAPPTPAQSPIPPTLSAPAPYVPPTKKEQKAERELIKAYQGIYLEVIEEYLGTSTLNDLDKIRNNKRMSPEEKLEETHKLIKAAQSVLKDSTLNQKPLLDQLLQNPEFVKKAQEGDQKGCDNILRELILSDKTVARSYKGKADIERNHVNMLEHAINYVGLDLDDEQKKELGKSLKEIGKDDKKQAKAYESQMKNPDVEDISKKLQESMDKDGFKFRLESAYKKMYPNEYEAKARADSVAEAAAAVHASSKASTPLTFSASTKAAPTQSPRNTALTPPDPSTTPTESRKLR